MRAGLVAVLAVLAACGLISAPGAPVDNQPIGPTVVLAEGAQDDIAWRYTAYRTAGGYCDELEIDGGGGGGGCTTGNFVVEPGTVSLSVQAGTVSPTIANGPTGVDVALVRLATRDHGDFEVPTFAAPVELHLPVRFFVAVMPVSATVVSAVTIDRDGEVLETVDLGPVP
jgi:hypothetical protein